MRSEGGGRAKEEERMRGQAGEGGGPLGAGCAETDKGGVEGGKETLDAPESSLAHHFDLVTVKQSTPSKPVETGRKKHEASHGKKAIAGSLCLSGAFKL